MDINKIHREKVRQEPHENALCCLKQILNTTPNKIAAVWPLASHLKNYPSKTNQTCLALLEKQG